MPKGANHVRRQLTDHLLIVDDQHVGDLRGLVVPVGLRMLVLDVRVKGEHDLEGGSCSGARINLDQTAVATHGPIDRGKPHASARLLRGEEGLEDAVHR